LEFNKVKEHAPDLQTFLSLPHLISKATYEKKNVEKLGSESKLNRKTIIGHLKIVVFCEFLHIFLSVEFEGPVYSFLCHL
jgi:hypothetical protein